MTPGRGPKFESMLDVAVGQAGLSQEAQQNAALTLAATRLPGGEIGALGNVDGQRVLEVAPTEAALRDQKLRETADLARLAIQKVESDL